jgi:hypothetical protein
MGSILRMSKACQEYVGVEMQNGAAREKSLTIHADCILRPPLNPPTASNPAEPWRQTLPALSYEVQQLFG